MDYVTPYGLALFVRVADTGSVTRAAEEMYISQPAVSQHLRRLERALGTALVERRGRRIALSAAGQAVLPLARQALRALERIPTAVAEVEGLLRGEVTIGASTTIGEFVLPKRLSRFAHAYPHLTVRLHIGNTEDIVRRVLDHSLQLGIVGLRPPNTALTATPFLEDAIVLVAAPDHPLAQRGLTARDLSRARVLVREEGSATRTLALEALARCGADTESAVGFGSNAAVRSAALAAYGVGALSRHVVDDDLAAGRLKALRLKGWRCRRRFYIVRRRDGRLTGGEEMLLEHLRREE